MSVIVFVVVHEGGVSMKVRETVSGSGARVSGVSGVGVSGVSE